jgi:hypothetical protein
MADFLVETYLPTTAAAADLAAVAQAAGLSVLRVIFIPEEETCFLLCQSESADAARAAAERAGFLLARVNEAVVSG